MITATRYHDISAGHIVSGHESKCAHLHGHNYRVTFEIAGDLDDIGRVMDFSVIKTYLCMWLEAEWDHKFLVFSEDARAASLFSLDPAGVIAVPFNPTAENMARYLVEAVAPKQLAGTGATLVRCTVEETRKCAATFTLPTT